MKKPIFKYFFLAIPLIMLFIGCKEEKQTCEKKCPNNSWILDETDCSCHCPSGTALNTATNLCETMPINLMTASILQNNSGQTTNYSTDISLADFDVVISELDTLTIYSEVNPNKWMRLIIYKEDISEIAENEAFLVSSNNVLPGFGRIEYMDSSISSDTLIGNLTGSDFIRITAIDLLAHRVSGTMTATMSDGTQTCELNNGTFTYGY
jgi:hypothetical protein